MRLPSLSAAVALSHQPVGMSHQRYSEPEIREYTRIQTHAHADKPVNNHTHIYTRTHLKHTLVQDSSEMGDDEVEAAVTAPLTKNKKPVYER